MTHPAPLRPVERMAGAVRVPSDKSIAQRALILSVLARGSSRVRLRAPGEDVLSTVGALRGLGAAIELVPRPGGSDDDPDEAPVELRVDGLGRDATLGRLRGDAWCGNSGTAMRLLAGAVAAGSGSARLSGDASLSGRPMERVAVPLRQMGAEVMTSDGHAPLTVVGGGGRPLRALEHRLPVPSAQVLGAISIAALAAEGRTTVDVPGPTRDHSERMLSAMGARVTREQLSDGAGTRTAIDGPATLEGRTVVVPGDLSSAAAWIVAATLHPNAEVMLPGVGLNPTRTAVADVLREMGAEIEIESSSGGDAGSEPAGNLVVRTARRLRAVSISADRVAALIDELPLLAVAMAAADGTSEVRGAGELRVKESDRIGAMAEALAAVGTDVEELPDGWRIRRGRPRAAHVKTHGDHRIAMAMAVAAWTGLAAAVTLDDPTCVAVSYAGFWRDAARLSAVGAGAPA